MPSASQTQKTYWIETYGCQMNKAESGSLELELAERGWTRAPRPDQAGVVVLNTCSVRRTAEERVWGRLGFYKAQKRRRPFRLVLMGCMGERLKQKILDEAPQVDLVVGNFQKHRLADLIEAGQGEAEARAAVAGGAPAVDGAAVSAVDGGPYRFSGRHGRSGVKAFVPIMHGCNNYCSYCVVPYVRGPEVSRSPESVLQEIRGLGEVGVREITLLGQNVNSYRHAPDGLTPLDFPGLLRRIIAALPTRIWLRFLTSHPKDLSEALVALMAAESSLCRHIHLPVQHGSDRVLAAMGRGYTCGQYQNLVERIRNSVPGVTITTDILIGFPGESDEDFRLTLELVREVGFDEAFTYRYNPREGTRAFALPDDVPEGEKLGRLEELIRLQRAITRRHKQARLGQTVEVLIEGRARRGEQELLARTQGDETVVLPGLPERIGSFATVRLVRLDGNTYRGEE
jgi:tRNA-2-methylthio-N6-dimethylallyladenosine synthase